MSNFGLNSARDMVGQALNDKFSPGKIDKYEAIDIKEAATGNGAEPSASAKAFLADQIQAGRVESGEARAVLDGIFTAPTQSFNEKISQLSNNALEAIRQGSDINFWGTLENASEIAGLAEEHLNAIKSSAGNSEQLKSSIDATLSGAKRLSDPAEKVDIYSKALRDISTHHIHAHRQSQNNDGDMRKLAADAIRNIHVNVRSLGGGISANGQIASLYKGRDDVYVGSYNMLHKIKDTTTNDFIKNQASNALNAAARARQSSYNAASNILLQTLNDISGGRTNPPAATGSDIIVETTVETTVTTNVQQNQ